MTIGFEPEWPTPPNIKSFITVRGEGNGRYGEFNLATHVDDEMDRVAANRRRLNQTLDLGYEPYWLKQVHGDRVAIVDTESTPTADGSYCDKPGPACVVLTADCLPILLCDRQGREVAALHGGWRGLAGGIIAAGMTRFKAKPEEMLAFLGPAIGPTNYEVDQTVVDAFGHLGMAFDKFATANPAKSGHYFLDLYAIARLQLQKLKVTAIFGGDFCTFQQERQFYSYRREGQCGRMASLIWIS